MSDLFSQLTGYNQKYIDSNSAKKAEETNETEEIDYSAVDFCQGETDTEEFETNFNFDIDNKAYNEYDDCNQFDIEG